MLVVLLIVLWALIFKYFAFSPISWLVYFCCFSLILLFEKVFFAPSFLPSVFLPFILQKK